MGVGSGRGREEFRVPFPPPRPNPPTAGVGFLVEVVPPAGSVLTRPALNHFIRIIRFTCVKDPAVSR